MNITPEEERFAKNTSILAEAVLEGVRDLYSKGYATINPTVVEFAIGVIQAFEKHYLIQGFIENSHEKCWDFIRTRNDEFFVKNASEIFKYLPINQVDLFKDLFSAVDSHGNKVIPRGLMDEIWDLFHAMVKISIKYIHNNRSPYSYSTQSGIFNAYGSSFFDNVNIAHHASVWNVNLDFPPKF